MLFPDTTPAKLGLVLASLLCFVLYLKIFSVLFSGILLLLGICIPAYLDAVTAASNSRQATSANDAAIRIPTITRTGDVAASGTALTTPAKNALSTKQNNQNRQKQDDNKNDNQVND